ncbi:hypothetical protein IQ260_13950 [Leptolyngbya cf. ectocarpi LEGE 11479]|uniref:Uncharacterized protein n=1 Tax=Leptolyngbya cf. ectocarpi LEGE 11479 TaxID=1828722 RepID=A0A928ZUM2_LEPEC|nr:hypothetical protein [Leptolyngbya ectocarpi]MBE9067756.1 hypothetical protein [Leptolyngbya cf. ectocarpi LEGE 11479]
MTSLIGLLILIISLWLCQAIDGLPHLLPQLSAPWWLWLGLGSIMLSWMIKDP